MYMCMYVYVYVYIYIYEIAQINAIRFPIPAPLNISPTEDKSRPCSDSITIFIWLSVSSHAQDLLADNLARSDRG